MLQRHTQIAGLVVAAEEFIWRMDFVHVLPAAARVRLKKGGEADIMENLIPVEGVHQVAHGAIGGVGGMLIVRQQNGRRDRDPKL